MAISWTGEICEECYYEFDYSQPLHSLKPKRDLRFQHSNCLAQEMIQMSHLEMLGIAKPFLEWQGEVAADTFWGKIFTENT